MKAKLVKNILNENNYLNEVIHWPSMMMGLYFIYHFIKNCLNDPYTSVHINHEDYELIDDLVNDLKTVIEQHRYVKYSENASYNIFEYNVYSNIINKEHHFSKIKIDKNDRILSYTVGTGKYAEFNEFPIRFSKKQYESFVQLIEEN